MPRGVLVTNLADAATLADVVAVAQLFGPIVGAASLRDVVAKAHKNSDDGDGQPFFSFPVSNAVAGLWSAAGLAITADPPTPAIPSHGGAMFIAFAHADDADDFAAHDFGTADDAGRPKKTLGEHLASPGVACRPTRKDSGAFGEFATDSAVTPPLPASVVIGSWLPGVDAVWNAASLCGEVTDIRRSLPSESQDADDDRGDTVVTFRDVRAAVALCAMLQHARLLTTDRASSSSASSSVRSPVGAGTPRTFGTGAASAGDEEPSRICRCEAGPFVAAYLYCLNATIDEWRNERGAIPRIDDYQSQQQQPQPRADSPPPAAGDRSCATLRGASVRTDEAAPADCVEPEPRLSDVLGVDGGAKCLGHTAASCSPPRGRDVPLRVAGYLIGGRLGRGNNAVVHIATREPSGDVNTDNGDSGKAGGKHIAVKMMDANSRHLVAEAKQLQRAAGCPAAPAMYFVRTAEEDRESTGSTDTSARRVACIGVELLGPDLYDTAAAVVSGNTTTQGCSRRARAHDSGISEASALVATAAMLNALERVHADVAVVHRSVKAENFCFEVSAFTKEGAEATSVGARRRPREEAMDPDPRHAAHRRLEDHGSAAAAVASASNLGGAPFGRGGRDSSPHHPSLPFALRLIDFGRCESADGPFAPLEPPFTGCWYSSRALVGLPQTQADDILSVGHTAAALLLGSAYADDRRKVVRGLGRALRATRDDAVCRAAELPPPLPPLPHPATFAVDTLRSSTAAALEAEALDSVRQLPSWWHAFMRVATEAACVLGDACDAAVTGGGPPPSRRCPQSVYRALHQILFEAMTATSSSGSCTRDTPPTEPTAAVRQRQLFDAAAAEFGPAVAELLHRRERLVLRSNNSEETGRGECDSSRDGSFSRTCDSSVN